MHLEVLFHFFLKPRKVAIEIKRNRERCFVMIIDTDATYMKNNKYFTGLPIAIEGIEADKGFWIC